MINCNSSAHAQPVLAEFLWWDTDCHPRFYCSDCVGWHLLGALYDPGTDPRGIDLLPSEGWPGHSAAWTSEPWWDGKEAA